MVEEVVPCSVASQAFVVYFEWDKSELTSQAGAVINQAVANVRSRGDCAPGAVTIVGHTDSSGSSSYNDRLSASRALAVSEALAAQGVATDIMSVVGKGETELAVSTRDGVREPLNRRSEVSIIVE